MIYRFILILLLFCSSCTAIRKVTYKIEGSHNALYKQKALLVYAVRDNKVWLTNPTHTHCYVLKGKQYAVKWEPGDTMIIDNNLDDFYRLRFTRKCE